MRNRLHSICPYFAMFPEEFARNHIENLTDKGDLVLDPFSGRGTTLLQALLMERNALAADINPVAYCITGAKAQVPILATVLAEIGKLELQFIESKKSGLLRELEKLPPFFARAFHRSTLQELLFLRGVLDWRGRRSHRFIAALVLGSLHGEISSPNYFSNQMPRTISTKPSYSLRFWSRHNLWPKRRQVFSILRSRATLRLGRERPLLGGRVKLVDARKAAKAFPSFKKKVKAVITSPPYFDTTSYEEDQWLRLWFLGCAVKPTYGQISRDDRYAQKTKYWQFLEEVWFGVAPLMMKSSFLVIRLGGKNMEMSELTDNLVSSVTRAFPSANMLKAPFKSTLIKRQTSSFVPRTIGCRFEVDYVFKI